MSISQQASRIAQIMGNRGVQQGAPVPTDPRQQTMMQQLGITNPLLQQFGQQVGNLVGADTRSVAQQVASGMKGLDPNDPESLLAVAKQIENYDPERAVQLRSLAASVVSKRRKEEADLAYTQAKIAKEARGGDAASSQFDAFKQYVDEEGNYFDAAVISDPNTGTQRRSIVPLNPAAPTPVGKLTAVSSAQIAERGEVKVDTAGRAEEAKKWGDIRVQSAVELPVIKESVDNIDTALRLLDTVETGGPINTAGTAIERFLGDMSGDKAELQVLMGNEMYKRLKPLFGGVISEGERQVVEEIYAGLKKGNKANAGILRSLRGTLEASYKRMQMARRSDTFEDYNTALDKLFPEGLEEQIKQDSSDLPAGVTEEDLAYTMKQRNMTRQQVLDALKGAN